MANTGTAELKGMAVRVETENIRRHCPPSCRRNHSDQPCDCGELTKIIARVPVAALYDGVLRYRAWFSPNPKNPARPRISNKERFNEQGWAEKPPAKNIWIPDGIYEKMLVAAAEVIMKSPQL